MRIERCAMGITYPPYGAYWHSMGCIWDEYGMHMGCMALTSSPGTVSTRAHSWTCFWARSSAQRPHIDVRLKAGSFSI